MEFVCPPPTALEAIPIFDCPEKIGQIQKMIFQRAGFEFVDPANAFTAEASWTALITAVDDTKIVITPYLESVVIPSPEPITEGGGDNSTLNGRELVVGETNPIVNGMMRNVPGKVVKALKKLAQEELVVYFINEFNQLVGISEDDGDTVTGIPLHAFFAGDAANEGKNTHDKAPIRFGVDYGWRDNLYIVKPAFDAKAIIVSTET